MKTVMIYDQMSADEVQFIVLVGDYSHLDRVYINGDFNNALAEELCNLLYADDGSPLFTPLDEFPVDVVKNGGKVIVAGLIP